MIATMRVSTTLCIEAKRKSSDVSISLNSKPAGNVFEISAITLLISALTAVALAPGDWLTINIAPGCASTFER